MATVVIDTYAAMAVLDHCKRVAVCTENAASTIIGYLIGTSSKGVFRVTNILPAANFKIEAFTDLKAYLTSDSRERIIGVYNTRNVDSSIASLIKNDQSIYLAVNLPTAEKLSLELTATLMAAKVDAEGKREYSFTDAPLTVATADVGANVVLATVMSQIFPEVAEELKSRDPISVETYAVEEKAGAEIDLNALAVDRKTLPHHISIADLEKQLADLAKIATEGAKGKNVGHVNVGIAKEIAELRAEAKKCLSNLEAEGAKPYAEDIEDVLTAKYIAELSKARFEAIRKSIEEAKEVARRYDNVRTGGFRNNNGFSAGGRGGRGGSSGFSRGRGGFSRGGRGGSRGGFRGGRGRGAAAASSE